MLYNLNKCSTYILIDVEYLIKKINECYKFYIGLYPEKKLNRFDITNLLTSIMQTTHTMHNGDNINVIFYYKLGNSEIPYSNGQLDVWEFNNLQNPVKLIYEQGLTMNLYSIFSDPECDDELSYNEEFIMHLRQIVTSQDAFTIVVCKDNENSDTINYWLEEFEKNIDKKFYIYRDIDYKIGIGYYSQKFSYVALDYAIASCMGLKSYEW